jgi:hypothetical protein
MRTVEEKVSDWWRAFDAIRQELVPKELRTILAEMKEVEGVVQMQSYVRLASDVMHADRVAAMAAAAITQSGVRRTTEYDEDAYVEDED